MKQQTRLGLGFALAATLAAAASAQGVEPMLWPSNPALAAGQQNRTVYGSTPQGETGVLPREPWRPAPPVAPPPPPRVAPPPPPVVVPPPPAPLPPPPPPARRVDRN